MPPPPYSAATSQVGYDGDVGLPYSAQPYLGGRFFPSLSMLFGILLSVSCVLSL